MKRIRLAGAAGLALLLAACGSGVSAPAAVQGAWGADCSHPEVKFDGGKLTVYADGKTYGLKSAALDNGQLTVTYDSDAGPITEVYAFDGQSLRMDHGTYNGASVTWEKAPMSKCAG
jgi:hypothetical protein